jgi:hypothetical protein
VVEVDDGGDQHDEDRSDDPVGPAPTTGASRGSPLAGVT